MRHKWGKAIKNVLNTYQELEKKYGKRGIDWKLELQGSDGIYDIMQIRLANGQFVEERIKLNRPF